MLKKNDAGAPRLPEYAEARQLPKHAAPALRRALREGRRLQLDRDSWFVDAESGEPIAPHPEIERELTDEELDRAEHRIGDRVIRRGRPPLEAPKQAIRIRLDADVVEHFRATGPGWQTRINDALRRAAKLKKAG
jgi:uncharacterized protein (DUF4415 family)